MFRNLNEFLHRVRRRFTDRFPFLVPRERRGTRAYLLTVALMLLALFVRLAIAPIHAGLQYLTFFPAITLAAIFGGYRCGLLATLIGIILATWIFIPPNSSSVKEIFELSAWANLVFLFDGIVLSFSIEAMHQFRLKHEEEFDDLKKSEVRVTKLNEDLATQIAETRQAETALAAQEAYFRMIAENVDDFIAVLDQDGQRLYNSPSYSKIFGSVNDMKGTDSFAEIHPDDRERVRQIFMQTVQSGIGLRTEYRFVLPNGGIRYMESSGGLIKSPQGEASRVVVVSHDITERRAAESRINKLAFYDTLTNLPNRRLQRERQAHAMAASKRTGRYGAVMFLDLDNFKPLNDTYGHDAGDQLLVEVAHRLGGCVREVDTVARFGGDEFVILLSELSKDKVESTLEARIVAEKIRNSLAEPYVLKLKSEKEAEFSVEYRCTSSIGVVLFIDHKASAEDILKWADMAMYQAKDAGRNQICFHNASQ
jgi:diguanylate cyclase (GGDEF)-like protein/PAS domain S-box-containing protein